MKTVRAIALLSLFALPACHRPEPSPSAQLKVDLVGAWVREIRAGATGLEGFDLRADGSVALLGIYSMNGVAWTVSRDELVISTNTDRYPQPTPIRLHIASLERGVLTLDADPPDYLAGTWRTTDVERVSGVVTYLEQIALPPEARVEVRMVRGERLVARTLVSPTGPVPIPFALSYLTEPAHDDGGDTLEARIVTADEPLFESPEPVRVEAAATGVELLVRRARTPR